jgi:hypothetical protein
MASGDEGMLTISIGVMVSPEPEAIGFLKRYNVALNYSINKDIETESKENRGDS